MLTVATMLWNTNKHSQAFSRCYNELWVMRLYCGFARNLTLPFRFVLFTDRPRELAPAVEQMPIATDPPTYAAYIEPFRLNCPMILVGLDTVIIGNIDGLAQYCLTASQVALPRDPFQPSTVCNGVALVPAGNRRIYDEWHGENDMEWLRGQREIALIDALFPGQVVSYKGRVREKGLGDARIVYFHGAQKPHELALDWINRHWRCWPEAA